MSDRQDGGFVKAVCISGVGGLPRPLVAEGELRVGLGFVGNKHSVGGEREVCLFEEETYADLRAEGSSVSAGTFGENLTISGLPFGDLVPGDRIRVGDEAEIEITKVRAPCGHLTQFDKRFPEALIGRSGWMAKVILGGRVRQGDPVQRS